MADNDIAHLTKRITSMSDLECSVEFELHTALYRAHQLGVPVAELARLATLPPHRVDQIVTDFDPADLPAPDDPDLDWIVRHPGVIFTGP
jgi:hypothetical protein